MKKPNKLLDAAVIVNSLICLLSIAGIVYILLGTNLDLFYKVEGIFDLIALLFATIYYVSGYSKESADMFKAFLLVSTINALVVVVVEISEMTSVVSLIFSLISLVIIGYLALGLNIGKNNSIGLCILLVILKVLCLIMSIVMANSSILYPSNILLVSQLALSLTILVSTCAKYIDKAERKSNKK